jgi:hypothetical protein
MNYTELNKLSNVLCLEGELWRDIHGFEGYYQVSNLGRVKRLACIKIIKGGVLLKYNEKILVASNDTSGYPQVALRFNTKRVARVHRLVAEAFLFPPSSELIDECISAGLNYVTVNHKDENTCNARIENLEWCTPLYNNTHGKSRKCIPSKSGESAKNAILTEEDVLEIVRLVSEKKLSQEKIAEMFGVKQITVSNIWTGRSWSHLTGIPWKARSRKPKREGAKCMSEQVILH